MNDLLNSMLHSSILDLWLAVSNAIDAIQTSDSFYEQYVVNGCIMFLMWYFALKYKPFYNMVMPVVRWVDSLLDGLADFLVRAKG